MMWDTPFAHMVAEELAKAYHEGRYDRDYLDEIHVLVDDPPDWLQEAVKRITDCLSSSAT